MPTCPVSFHNHIITYNSKWHFFVCFLLSFWLCLVLDILAFLRDFLLLTLFPMLTLNDSRSHVFDLTALRPLCTSHAPRAASPSLFLVSRRRNIGKSLDEAKCKVEHILSHGVGTRHERQCDNGYGHRSGRCKQLHGADTPS
jgi:hypothetical protein